MRDLRVCWPVLGHSRIYFLISRLRAHPGPGRISRSDPRLPVVPSKPIEYTPMAFLTSPNSSMISKFQLGLYTKMCLGIDVKPRNNDHCPCGAKFGTNLGPYDPLSCNKWAGKSWHAAHNGVVTAVKEIAMRAGLRATDNNSILRSNYRHLTSGKFADAFIDGGGHLSVTDAHPTSGLQHSTRNFGT